MIIFKPTFFKKLFFAVLLLIFFPITNAGSQQNFRVLDSSGVKIIFEKGLEAGARKVENLFPYVQNKTESLFGFKGKSRPTVVLIKTRQRFLKIADHPITMAFAVPGKNLIVIDYSKVITHPFSLESTFLHEFCHLALHHNIRDIPRWLDEGTCQWASGGVDEIIYGNNQSALNLAAVTESYLSFRDLSNGFPERKNQRVLAYQQSKSFIDFIVENYGKEKFIEILKRMRQGYNADSVFYEVLGSRVPELEKKWRQTLSGRLTWLTWLSSNLYEVLFFCAALITVFGFFKLIRKKRNYADNDSDDYEE